MGPNDPFIMFADGEKMPSPRSSSELHPYSSSKLSSLLAHGWIIGALGGLLLAALILTIGLPRTSLIVALMALGAVLGHALARSRE